jgi:hypothetical protein
MRLALFRAGLKMWDDRPVTRLRPAHPVASHLAMQQPMMPRALYLTTRRHVDLMRLVGTGCMPAVIR